MKLSERGLRAPPIAMLGILLLIGIVKKNGILLVDFALELERNEGKSSQESIYQACILRFRPILMTTMAALLGAVPLTLSAGTGSEIRQPLGYTIVGGLLLSQLLTLFTTPAVHLYLDALPGSVRRLPSLLAAHTSEMDWARERQGELRRLGLRLRQTLLIGPQSARSKPELVKSIVSLTFRVRSTQDQTNSSKWVQVISEGVCMIIGTPPEEIGPEWHDAGAKWR